MLDFLPMGVSPPDAIRSEIEAVARNRRSASETVVRLQEAIDAYNPALAEAVNFGEYQNLDEVFGVLAPILTPVVVDIRTEASAHTFHLQSRREAEERYAQTSQTLVMLNQKLAKQTERSIRMTQDDLNATLAKVPGVRGLIVDDKTISLTFLNVVMTPDVNRFSNINNGGRVSIPLGDITAIVTLSSGYLMIASPNGREGGFGVRAHPHVLSGDKPCLGGFEGTYYDACQKGDIEVIALVIRMFLQQANSGDAAGRYWPEWMPAKALFQRRDCAKSFHCDGVELDRAVKVNLNKFGKIHSMRTVVYISGWDRATAPTKPEFLGFVEAHLPDHVQNARDLLGDLPILLKPSSGELW